LFSLLTKIELSCFEMIMPGKHLLLAFLYIALGADSASGFSVARPWSVAVASSSSAAVARSSASSLRAAKGGGGGKIKKKSVRSAQTDKGFGSPPPKLADVLASFKSRVPEDADSRPCPCGSGDVYADCCGPLHRGERFSSPTFVFTAIHMPFPARRIAPCFYSYIPGSCALVTYTSVVYYTQAIVFVRP
jgi:hypothetical protein